VRFEPAFECVRCFDISRDQISFQILGERMLTRLGFSVWELKKLLIRREKSASGLISVKKMIEMCRLLCG